MLNKKSLIDEILDEYDVSNTTVKVDNKSWYDFDNDVVHIDNTIDKDKEFIMAVLHEVKHAIQNKNINDLSYKYEKEMSKLAAQGKNPYNNKFEKQANNFEKKEIDKWM